VGQQLTPSKAMFRNTVADIMYTVQELRWSWQWNYIDTTNFWDNENVTKIYYIVFNITVFSIDCIQLATVIGSAVFSIDCIQFIER
jgi:hypothetical protein